MLDNIILSGVLFLDIETVPIWSDYDKVPERFKYLWDKKAQRLIKDDEEDSRSIYDRAGIYAEFGKIVCISVGAIKDGKLRIKSFADHDEKKLLMDFASLLNTRYNADYHQLCAHNGKEFDFPYICRRMVINGIKLPSLLNIAGKKPWEIKHIDTMELWKFGDFKNYTSLELLTAVFDIPTPKDDIDGSEVGKVYWQDNDLDRIVTYCQKDVVSIVQLMLKYLGQDLLPEEAVSFV